MHTDALLRALKAHHARGRVEINPGLIVPCHLRGPGATKSPTYTGVLVAGICTANSTDGASLEAFKLILNLSHKNPHEYTTRIMFRIRGKCTVAGLVVGHFENPNGRGTSVLSR